MGFSCRARTRLPPCHRASITFPEGSYYKLGFLYVSTWFSVAQTACQHWGWELVKRSVLQRGLRFLRVKRASVLRILW